MRQQHDTALLFNWKRNGDFAESSGSPILCPSWGISRPIPVSSSLLCDRLTPCWQEKIIPTSALVFLGHLLLKSAWWCLTFQSNISESSFPFRRCYFMLGFCCEAVLLFDISLQLEISSFLAWETGWRSIFHFCVLMPITVNVNSCINEVCWKCFIRKYESH